MNPCIFKVRNHDTNYEYSKAGMQNYLIKLLALFIKSIFVLSQELAHLLALLLVSCSDVSIPGLDGRLPVPQLILVMAQDALVTPHFISQPLFFESTGLQRPLHFRDLIHSPVSTLVIECVGVRKVQR